MKAEKSSRSGRNIKILATETNFSLVPCLEALEGALDGLSAELFVLTHSEGEKEREICARLKRRGVIAAHAFFSRRQFSSPQALANHLFMTCAGAPLFFLESAIHLAPSSLRRLLSLLEDETILAGANPRLSAAWVDDGYKRAAFLGIVVNYQKQLHYLYEGVPLEEPLARQKRRFQLAHPGAFLLRGEDFQKAGGFRLELGYLAHHALCTALAAIRPGGFACLDGAEGAQLDRLDFWNICAMWNSALRRGRLRADGLRPDYAAFCHADGLGYTCDSWLAEGPQTFPWPAASGTVKSWLEWRQHPRPATLVDFLLSLPPALRETALEICRNRPSSLPGTLRYYHEQAEKLIQEAGKFEPELAAAVKSWQKRIRQFHYGELKPGIELLKQAGIYNCSLDECPAVYDAWVETAESFTKLEAGEDWPEIAVAMPVWNPDRGFLAQALESVLGQTYGKWQLCVADDASSDPEIRPLLESFRSRSSRIRMKFRSANGHICRATNSALELVDAPFTAFLDHDDLLSPHALMEVAALAARKPALGCIYSDDDRIDENNVRRSPFFKPDFEWGLFGNTGHLSVFATGLLREVGGLRPGTEGAQDFDLFLRARERLETGRIAHIPKILYHWRAHENSTAASVQAKPYVIEAAKKAMLEAAARAGQRIFDVFVEKNRIFRPLCAPPRDLRCAVILLLGEVPPSSALLARIGELASFVKLEVRVQPLRENFSLDLPFEALPFVSRDYAKACNAAVARVGADILLFISASLEPDQTCRLEQLVEFARQPHIAMAGGNIWHGARLHNGGWYPAGDGRPFPLLRGMERGKAVSAAWGCMAQTRHVLGIPWECMALRREFCESGGFLESGFGPFATVDFALRAMRHNAFAAMTPWVEWQMPEPPREPNKAEVEALLARWRAEIASCGLRNPNLGVASDGDWTLIL